MLSQNDLQSLLQKIDHKGYPAYKELRGKYQFPVYLLSIDHVQGDPFASPSKISIHIPGKQAAFPEYLYENSWRRISLQDTLLRKFGRAIQEYSFLAKGSGKSGLMSVSRPGQEIIERSACQMNPATGDIILCMEVGFPANGRTINARELEKVFFEYLPKCVRCTCFYKSLSAQQLQNQADLADNQQYIREMLQEKKLVAFVANGSILPRESGVSKQPMKGAVAFASPRNLAVTMQVPHGEPIVGMGIPQGITLIVGGGYHGKSTLLKAIELGVYNHISGDGREYVITEPTAMKVRAEDGRSIQNVDISLFINHLPNGKDTSSFFTEDASGSTSQAAGVVEAMEMGSHTLLMDEDTSATNFMIRDELMQLVVHRDSEPITPFVDRVRELYEKHGVSTLLVAGSSGSYFHKADLILQMENYEPRDITEPAKEQAKKYPLTAECLEEGKAPSYDRIIKALGETARGGQRHGHGRGNRREQNGGLETKNERVKIKVNGCDTILMNKDAIDMRYVEQIVDSEQMYLLGIMLDYLKQQGIGDKTVQELIGDLYRDIEKNGMGLLARGGYLAGGMAMVRPQELYACVNRYRGVRF